MRVIVQRVTHADVQIEGQTVGAIQQGFMLLVGVGPKDTPAIAEKLAAKIVKLRVFSDPEGKMNLSVQDVGGAILSISQFTLYADVRKGNRPGFTDAASPELGAQLYDKFNDALRTQGLTVATGEFGADMAVSLTNDGPVTIIYDTEVLNCN